MAAGQRRRRGQGGGEASSRKISGSEADLSADRGRALALTPVSRETVARLDSFVALLLDWQRRMNLIASSTEVPSIHSLNVVISCHGSLLATMYATSVAQRTGSRVSRGDDSLYLLKPGEIEKL